MSDSTCPHTRQLITYAIDQDRDTVSNDCIEHIGQCSQCQDAVELLRSLLDPLVLGIKHTSEENSSDFSSEEELLAVQQLLKNMAVNESKLEATGPEEPGDFFDDEFSISESPKEDPSSLQSQLGLDDFEVLEPLGVGGMGAVYLARQISLDKVVALKTFRHGHHGRIEGDVARLRREAHTVAGLNHAGIPKIHGAWLEGGEYYIAMDYVSGVTLKNLLEHIAHLERLPSSFSRLILQCQLLKKDGHQVVFDSVENTKQETSVRRQVPGGSASTQAEASDTAQRLLGSDDYIRGVCRIIQDVALILHYAHGKNVVHRDIKPSNIITDGDRSYVIDFGISKIVEDVSLTEPGQLLGTPMYMSPEQVSLSVSVDHRSDIYSLGMTLYHLLVLRPPLRANSPEAVLRSILTKPLIPLGTLNRSVSRDLESIVHKASAKDPDKRYQDAMEFATDLRCYLDRKPVQAEAYHYRFAPQEIIACRPSHVGWSAIWLSYCAMFYGIILLPIAVAGAFRRDDPLGSLGLACLRYLVPCLLGAYTGWSLQKGAKWAGWFGGVLAIFLAGDCLYYLANVYHMMQSFKAMTTLLQFGHLIVGRIPIAVGGAWVVYTLVFDRRSRNWFQFSHDAHREYRELR